MNQILSVEMPNGRKNKSKSSIHSIVIVFVIILIIFGIGMASTGAYSYYKNVSNKKNNGLQVSSNTKPIITIERVNASTINIVASHDKEIASVVYNFDEEEPEEVSGDGKNEMKIEVELPVGESNINIVAKDINGISASYKSSFTVEQKPEIKLEQVEGQIQVTVESKINIDTISYYWDDDEENAKVLTINETKTVTLIDVIQGNHTLNIIAVDVNGNKQTKTQKVIGDNKPTLNVTTDGQKFIIEASDDEKLSKIQIKLNSNDEITEEIDSNQYYKEIELEEGVNKLTIKVYNKNDISETKKVKYSKE